MNVQVGQSKQVTLPENTYYISKQHNKELQAKEDHIIKKPLGATVTADKLANDVLVYAPKGLKGSVNSNFYEFLSMGIVPYIIGSGTLIALYNLANKYYSRSDAFHANALGKKMALGVVLYGVGKWLGGKFMNKSVKLSTGIDTDLTYKKIVHQLPENKDDKPTSSVEFHKVYESVDFPRWDLINKYGEAQNDRYKYYDKIAKRMGYDKKLNAPDQAVQSKIKEVVTKSVAAKNVSSYLWAATGVALAFQPGFEFAFKTLRKQTPLTRLKRFPLEFGQAFKDSFKSLWKGVSKSKSSRVIGKALILGAALSSVFGWLNAVSSFKAKNTKNTKINFEKDYEEC